MMRLALLMMGCFLLVQDLLAEGVTVRYAPEAGTVDVYSEQRPLRDVLELIGERAGISIRLSERVDRTASVNFQGVPLPGALTALTEGLSTVAFFSGVSGERRLAELWVLPEGQAPVALPRADDWRGPERGAGAPPAGFQGRELRSVGSWLPPALDDALTERSRVATLPRDRRSAMEDQQAAREAAREHRLARLTTREAYREDAAPDRYALRDLRRAEAYRETRRAEAQRIQE